MLRDALWGALTGTAGLLALGWLALSVWRGGLQRRFHRDRRSLAPGCRLGFLLYQGLYLVGLGLGLFPVYGATRSWTAVLIFAAALVGGFVLGFLVRPAPLRGRSPRASRAYGSLLLQLAVMVGAAVGIAGHSRTVPFLLMPPLLILACLFLRRVEGGDRQVRVMLVHDGGSPDGQGRPHALQLEGSTTVSAGTKEVLALLDDSDQLSALQPDLARCTMLEPAPDQRVARFRTDHGSWLWTATCLPQAAETRLILQCEFSSRASPGVIGRWRQRRRARTTVHAFLKDLDQAFTAAPAGV